MVLLRLAHRLGLTNLSDEQVLSYASLRLSMERGLSFLAVMALVAAETDAEIGQVLERHLALIRSSQVHEHRLLPYEIADLLNINLRRAEIMLEVLASNSILEHIIEQGDESYRFSLKSVYTTEAVLRNRLRRAGHEWHLWSRREEEVFTALKWIYSHGGFSSDSLLHLFSDHLAKRNQVTDGEDEREEVRRGVA